MTSRNYDHFFPGKMTPFVVRVVTDENEGEDSANPDDTANRGFKILYDQTPCLGSG